MKVIYHVVLLRFKQAEKVQPCSEAIARMRQFVAGMLSFTGGPYSSPEGLNQGFTHGCVMTFADATARNTYLTHPEHEKLKDEFLPFVESVVAFDFEGETPTSGPENRSR